MGYELRRWLRDQLPPDVSKGERLVALELADQANEETRRCWPDIADLSKWTGVSASGVSDALRRLALRGWEFRVEVGKGRDGRPLYAYAGKKTVYRVPDERAHARGAFERCRAQEEGPDPRDLSPEGPGSSGPEGPDPRDQRARGIAGEGPDPRAPSPQSPQSSPQPSPHGSDSLRSSARGAEETITEEETAPEDREPEQVIEVEAEPSTARRYHKATETERAEVRAFIDRNKPVPPNPATDPDPLALCRCGVPYGKTGVHHDPRHPRHHPFRREAA